MTENDSSTAVRGIEPQYHLTDHLGSVRAVVNASGEILERSDYYPFGLRWEDSSSAISGNRYRYNGKEDQLFVGVPYADYGARMLNKKLGIWHGVDQLAEITPEISPFAFCKNNPIKHVDPDGRFPVETLWDAMNVCMGIQSFVSNLAVGNFGGAAVDGLGVAVDVLATAIPYVPGGVGSIIKSSRAGANAVDAASDAAKIVDKTADAARSLEKGGDAAKGGEKTYQTYTKTNPKTGEVYSGRTSGTGSPYENVKSRDRDHHKNKEGFGPAELDRSSSNPDAIRGREQELIDLNGGARSQGGTSGNKIDGVSKSNPNAGRYEEARKKLMGN